jgi:polysaccharide pyruvyl transferase CsaB
MSKSQEGTAKALVLLGYYGFGNAGDEALLSAILQGVAQVAPSVHPVVLTADPSGTAALHNVATGQRWSLGAIIRTFRGAQALMLGGGSLLQDVTSRRSVYYYLGVLSLAQVMGLRTCLFGQGIGPLRSRLARLWAKCVLRRCQGIWLRDEASYNEVQKLGVRCVGTSSAAYKPLLRISSDPAFLLQDTKASVVDAIHNSAPQWVVAVRPWPAPLGASESDWQKRMAAALTKAAQMAKANLLFITMQPDTDAPLAESLCQLVNSAGLAATVIKPTDFKQAQSLIGQADLVIGMRLHALVMAAISGVAAVAISYDPKVSALAQQLKLPGIAWSDLSNAQGAVNLAEQIQVAWRNAAIAGPALRQQAREMRKQVLDDLSQALALSIC